VAGDAAVGEEVGRVGKDEVDGILGDGGEDFEAVALVDAEVVFGVVEGGGWEIRGGFGHDDDRSGSLIRWIRESSGEETEEKEGKGFNAEVKENAEFAEKKLGPAKNQLETGEWARGMQRERVP
jgi:hypothetical protein